MIQNYQHVRRQVIQTETTWNTQTAPNAKGILHESKKQPSVLRNENNKKRNEDSGSRFEKTGLAAAESTQSFNAYYEIMRKSIADQF